MLKLIILPLKVFIKGVLLGGCGCTGLIVGAVLALVIGLVVVFFLIS